MRCVSSWATQHSFFGFSSRIPSLPSQRRRGGRCHTILSVEDGRSNFRDLRSLLPVTSIESTSKLREFLCFFCCLVNIKNLQWNFFVDIKTGHQNHVHACCPCWSFKVPEWFHSSKARSKLMVWRRTLAKIQYKSISVTINFNNPIIILQTSNKPIVYYHTWYSLMMLNQSQVEGNTFNRTLQVKRSVPTRIWIPDLSVRALSVFARSFANFLKPKASWQEAPLHEGVHDWNATHPVRGSQILRSCRHKISILGVYYCYCIPFLKIGSINCVVNSLHKT